jgi:hypothetical protein
LLKVSDDKLYNTLICFFIPEGMLLELPTFSGKGPGEDDELLTGRAFSSIVDRVLKNSKWNDRNAAAYVINQLTGPAEEWSINFHSLTVKQSWKMLKPKFIAQFPQTASLAHKIHVRHSLHQRPGESVKDFAQRCSWAQFIITEDDVSSDLFEAVNIRDVAMNFVLGLRPSIRKFMLKCEEASLEGYLELAKQFEMSLGPEESQEQQQTSAKKIKLKDEHEHDHNTSFPVSFMCEQTLSVEDQQGTKVCPPQPLISSSDESEEEEDEEEILLMESRSKAVEGTFICRQCCMGYISEVAMRDHIRTTHLL